MTSEYMSNKDFKDIMADNDWKTSRAVTVYLVKASHCFKQRELMSKSLKLHPQNRVLRAEYKRLDEKRVEYVWSALDTAEAEFLQGWRYLEDGSDFVNAMLVKYKGDLTKCTRPEKLKSEYIELLERERRFQINNGLRG
ncbi:hypothetical protein [Levilactobacillus enshiensis]|uniref:hypothetical protein n=1 Tax=Levilactobacillus enshiensis TaxID=2590213 RepID=UPI00131B1002|nr:hypothetical protein [Levilactobacillus enshiensis]